MEGRFRPPLDIRGYIDRLGPGSTLVRTQDDEDENWRVTAQPFLWGGGEAECSTCTDLVPSPHVIFDVNGYYRELGFEFPFMNITRSMLRKAYLACRGENSIRLTMIMKVLLDKTERRKYDLTRLGDRYIDREWTDYFNREAYAEARRRNLYYGRNSTPKQVLEEWGLDSGTPAEPGLDSVGGVGHDLDYPTDDGGPEAWEWSYYLWGSRNTDTTRLSAWQRMLLKECILRGIRMHFCVGFSGRRTHARWTTGVIGQHRVIFLREDVEPTDELAAYAVSAVLREEHIDEVRKVEACMATPSFRRGGQAAEEAAKQQRTSFSPRNKYLTIKEDRGTAVIRLIDDGDPHNGWISVRQHSYVPTKGPDDSMSDEVKAKWPKRFGAVCRHDDAFKGIYKDCYICDKMRKEDGKPYGSGIRLFARAVLREPVLGTPELVEAGLIKEHMVNQVVGYEDATVIDSDTGEERPDVVILNYGMDNFFGSLQGYYDINGTVLDRDFHITRKGTGTDTTYAIVARDPLRNEDGSIFDLRDPETRKPYEGIVNLEEVVANQASDEHYARYFDPTKPIPQRAKRSDEGGNEANEPATPVAAASGPDQDQIKAMRERVKNGLKLSS